MTEAFALLTAICSFVAAFATTVTQLIALNRTKRRPLATAAGPGAQPVTMAAIQLPRTLIVRTRVAIAVTLVLAAVVAWLLVERQIQPGPPSGLAPSASASDQGPTASGSPTTSPNAPSKRAQITSPQDLTEVSRSEGVFLRGRADLRFGEHLWIFDHDPTDNYLYQTHEHPLDVSDGTWAFNDAPTGDPGWEDSKVVAGVVLVLADSSCNDAILNAKPEGDTVRFKKLPAGCVEQDRIRVVIARA